jgi:hypothetical protein
MSRRAFNDRTEQLFDQMNNGAWPVLAGIAYPATRLARAANTEEPD